MKTIMIICGAGHATSTVVRTKVESWLKSEGLASEVEVKQSSIGAQAKDIAADKYDIVISTTQVPENRMVVFHKEIDLNTVANRPSYHDVTSDVMEALASSGVQNGICVVSSPHTTCAVFFEEFMHDKNYYGDEFLQVDLNEALDKIVPVQRTEGQYHSPGPEHIAYGMAKTDPDYPAKEWTMLNTDGHLRSTLLGASETLIIKDGNLLNGKVGYIYFVDFDQTRERRRKCNIVIMGE